ncbi:MAG: Ca2+-transporting ATPase [Verrucomicrobiales bacterium]|jgi:Ca2+-transporting ATPase
MNPRHSNKREAIQAPQGNHEAMIDLNKTPWCTPASEVVANLGIADTAVGLNERQVAERLEMYGANASRKTAGNPWLSLLAGQFQSLVVWILVAAAILSGIFSDWIECAAIIAVLLINALIGFVTELKAVRSMDALRRLTDVMATVRRDGGLVRMSAKQIVPGDIVILDAGDIVPADLRLLETSRLQIDESSLTGESVPVEKKADEVALAMPLAERSSMAYKATPVTRGTAVGIVTDTGANTEIGQISTLVSEADDQNSPLDKQLDRLGSRLIGVTVAVTILTVLLGISAGKDTYLMIQTGLALAVAAIPEGLPIVATIALARGMWRMAKHNALINRLSAVETLGATGIICTDKTGTLTQNEMTLVRLALPGSDIELTDRGFFAKLADETHSKVTADEDGGLLAALSVASLCNNASIDGGRMGDPLEVALLVGADLAAIDRSRLLKELPRESETAFDSDIKMMATRHSTSNGLWLVAVKGAAEPVIAACANLSENDQTRWLEQNETMAAGGLRVIAVAQKTTGNEDEPPYAGLTFLGLVGVLDPPRDEIAPALNACRTAGIRVVMMTGDQAPTAKNIAQRVGLVGDEDQMIVIESGEFSEVEALDESTRDRLLDASIFCRVSPRQKLDLVKLYQNSGSIVAMTGDGVNDAPALKQADIGIAMGVRGTEVAKETADMILRDDRFSSIVEAIFQGRVIFANIRKFVVYLMSCNLSEILVVGIGAALATGIPILPLQILFLNLVTDVFPALALGAGTGDPAVMKHRPRPSGEPILRRRDWLQIVGFSLLLASAVLTSHQFAARSLGFDESQCISVAFLVLAFAQLFHVFNMGTGWEVTRNRYVWGALLICIALLSAAYFFTPLALVMGLVQIGTNGWGLVLVASLLPLVAGRLSQMIRRSIPGAPSTIPAQMTDRNAHIFHP